MKEGKDDTQLAVQGQGSICSVVGSNGRDGSGGAFLKEGTENKRKS